MAVTTVEMLGRSRKRSRSPESTSQMTQHRVDFARAVDERHVPGGLGEQREVLHELTTLERHVGGAHLRPHEVELRQFVHQRRALTQVAESARPAIAGAVVHRLGDAAARSEVERFAFAEKNDVVRG